MLTVHDLPALDPVAAFAPFAEDACAVLLDSAADGGGRGRYSYLCTCPAMVTTAKDSGDDPFATAQAMMRGRRRAAVPGLPPFQGGVVGWFGYDLCRHVERVPVPARDVPGFHDLALGLFDVVVAWDHQAGRAWLLAEDAGRAEAVRRRLEAAPPLADLDWRARAPWRAETTRADYEAAVAAAIDYVRAGDIFQANLSQRFLAELPPDLSPWVLYRRLRQLAPAPFAAFVKFGDQVLAGASPERFLRLDADGTVETRPIKGTRPRGATSAEDAALAAELTASAKDRAENLMIVDLLRNDLSRVCRVGSVRAPELMRLESFAAVHHLVSAVQGRLRPGLGAVDLLRAAFPGGSITGAPKIRAMEIIAALESARRGPYCGTVAWLGFDGAMDSNIVIRTVAVQGRTAVVQAGGGIVADSEPAAEYQETLVKARPLLASLEGTDP